MLDPHRVPPLCLASARQHQVLRQQTWRWLVSCALPSGAMTMQSTSTEFSPRMGSFVT